LKIAHIAPHADASGNGVVNVAVDLACAQATLGHEIAFLSPGGSLVKVLECNSVTYAEIPKSMIGITPVVYGHLRKFFIQFKPDVVHAHMVPGALLARLLRRTGPFRLVTSVHNAPRLHTRLMGSGDVIICVSEALAAAMCRQGIPARKVRVVHNGPLGSPRWSKAAGPVQKIMLSRPAIVTVAGLFAHKGIADLIAAFSLVAAHLPAAMLYIVGDGPMRSRLERQARCQPCADRIVFTGFVDDPRAYMRAADLFVLASRREGFGLVLAEAREAGCAIVATDVGGIREVLDGSAAGVLVRPHRPQALGEAMLDLLRNKEQRRALAARAASGLDWLNVGRMAEETLAVYRGVLEGPRR